LSPITFIDDCLAPDGGRGGSRAAPAWAGRALFLATALFALAVPHSIAAAHIALGIAFIAWVARDLASRHLHLSRTPVDVPLICFAALTIISAVLSVEPQVSIPRLRSLLLFFVLYLIASNLNRRAVPVMLTLLIASGLIGVGFSLAEKTAGRGMIVTSLQQDSPLADSDLRPGDAIWMIGRHRVSSLDTANAIIQASRTGDRLTIEALHAGDPLPVVLDVTDPLKFRSNPLGITVDGRTRRFRVSGFSRHFLTYAEQMQILVLLVLGFIIAALILHRGRGQVLLLALTGLLFTAALILTGSRAAIASFLATLVVVLIASIGRRGVLAGVALVVLLAPVAMMVLVAERAPQTGTLADDSASRRLAYMSAGIRLIPRHPLLGVGLDSHKLHWKEWGFPGDYVTHTHSTPVQIALDRGLPALGCYMWMIGVMLLTVWRDARRALDEGDVLQAGISLGCFGAIAGFSASSLVNYNFGDAEVLLLLLLVFALSLVARIPARGP
jgi:hypothetical protein